MVRHVRKVNESKGVEQIYDKNIKNQSIFISSTTLIKAQLSLIKDELLENSTEAFFTDYTLLSCFTFPIAYFVAEFIWNN